MGLFSNTNGETSTFESLFFLSVLMSAEIVSDKGQEVELLKSINNRLERLCDKLC